MKNKWFCITCLALAICFMQSIMVLAQNEISQFSDLKTSHWAYKDINEMAKKDIIKGMPDGSFGVNLPITREAYATVLARAFNLNSNKVNVSSFDDVNPESWSSEYIEMLKPYMRGQDSNMKFKPKENITREDAIYSLVLLLGLYDEDVDLSNLDQFDDKNDIDQRIRGIVSIAIQHNLIKGDGTKINPKKSLTRAEASVLINDVLNNYLNSNEEEKKVSLPSTFEELGVKYSLYNDGYVRFIYPMKFDKNVTKIDGAYKDNPNMKSFNANDTNIRLSVYYTLDPCSFSYEDGRGIGTNSLTEIFTYLNQSKYKDDEKKNYNNQVIMLTHMDSFGDRIHIYGRGIGNTIPQIVIMGIERYDASGKLQEKTKAERYSEDEIAFNYADKIKNSFKVVAKEKSYKSIGMDKKVMETSIKDGEVLSNINEPIEIRCNANIAWGSKYDLKNSLGEEIKNVDMYYSTNANVLKIKFGQELENGNYILTPQILNDIDGNYISCGVINFSFLRRQENISNENKSNDNEINDKTEDDNQINYKEEAE